MRNTLQDAQQRLVLLPSHTSEKLVYNDTSLHSVLYINTKYFLPVLKYTKSCRHAIIVKIEGRQYFILLGTSARASHHFRKAC